MKIKQIPEDFEVEEITDIPELSEGGQYTYFWLTKTNWTTVRALSEIAKRCHTSKKRFNFAGNKDKQAITKQLCCAFKVSQDTLRSVKLKDIKIEVIGQGEEKINLGDLKRNRFKIIVREVTTDLEQIEEKAKFIGKYGIPNYFDEQRFGSFENTHIIGKHIIKGELKEAVDCILRTTRTQDYLTLLYETKNHQSLERSVLNWLINYKTDYAGAMRTLHKKIRLLYVHALQSFIFNSALSEIIKENGEYYTIKFLSEELSIPKYKLENKQEALIGFETKLKRDSFSKKVKELMDKFEIKLEDFKCKKMPELASEGNLRDIIIKPKDLEIKQVANDVFEASFELPKGAYATLLLKCLFE